MIKLLKQLMFIAWLFLMLVVGLWIGFENSTKISVSVVGIGLPSAAVGTYLVACLLIGLLLGFLTSYLLTQAKLFKKHRELAKTKRQLAKLNTNELAN